MLEILYNEATRQEAIDAYRLTKAFHDPKGTSEIVTRALKVHGPYTIGFYEDEHSALREALTNARSK